MKYVCLVEYTHQVFFLTLSPHLFPQFCGPCTEPISAHDKVEFNYSWINETLSLAKWTIPT